MTNESLFDTHCHVDAYDNPLAVLVEASAAGVHVVAVTEDPGRYRLLRTRLGRRDGIDVALGYHPLRAGTLTPHDLARFFRLLPQTVWVGEIGLDFSRAGRSTRAQQLHAFESILADPGLRTRAVTVHSRGAEREVISRLSEVRQPAILHWYTGSLDGVDDALAAGLSFSFNSAMLRSRRAVSLLGRIPHDRVLLETDGPFATDRGHRSRPAGLVGLVRSLAAMWEVADGEAMATIVANQRRILRLAW